MKKHIALLTLLLCVLGAFAQEPQLVESKISDVFVYLQGAQVSRTANVNLKKGENILHFTGITNLLNEESIRIETDESITILAVILRTPDELSDADKKKFDAFNEEKAKIMTEINRQKKVMDVYNQEEQVILANKNISGQEKGVVISELKQAADFYRSRLTEIYDTKFMLKQKIAELRKEIYKIAEKELEFREEIAKRKSLIEVKANVKTDVSKPFIIRYFVAEAGWSPVYDIRVKDIDSPLTITGKAKVVQNTQEDWTKVNLLLSTGNPANSIVKPDLQTYWLSFNNPPKRMESYEQQMNTGKATLYGNVLRGRVTDTEGMTIPGVSIVVTGTNVGTVSDMDGNYELTVPAGAQTVTFSFVGMVSKTLAVQNLQNASVVLEEDYVALDEVVVVGFGIEKSLKGRVAGLDLKKEKEKKQKPVKEYIPIEISRKIIDMEYKIDVPYTIPSDGESYVVNMVDFEVPAEYEYHCVPKYSKDAYLAANILDWSEYNFLDGEANVYFGSKFVGKSAINTAILSDTMQLSIGVDKSITIERENIKDFTKRKFLAGDVKETKGWEITLRNNKQKDIKITVEDQFPISHNSEIEVEQIEMSGAELNKDTGKLVWKLSITPNNEKKLYIKYEVRYPRNRTLFVE